MADQDWIARREALYLLAGRAVHSSQLLETQLRLSVSILNEVLEVQIDFRSLAAPENTESLGRLIGALRSAGGVPATARSVLAKALESRNRIVHQFFVRNADAFSDHSVFTAARAELASDIEAISAGAKLAHERLLELCRTRGIDDAALVVRQARIANTLPD